MKNLRLITQDFSISGHVRWAKNNIKSASNEVFYFYCGTNITEISIPISIKTKIIDYKKILSPNCSNQLTLTNQLTDELNHFYNIYKKNKNKFTHIMQMLKIIQMSVITGFKRGLRVKGVGYKFSLNTTYRVITIEVGYSYLLQVHVEAEFYSNLHKKFTELEVQSHNLSRLTAFLSKVRKLRPPDIYKGKGIRYKKDPVRRKEGKKKKSF